MIKSVLMKNFHNSHPFAEDYDNGINSLFRFYKIDLVKINHLKHLFIEQKLYHSYPDQFNDPFECKPHFNWPKDRKKIKALHNYFKDILKKEGLSRNEIRFGLHKTLKNKNYIETEIIKIALKTYNTLRICCFTTQKENLLFWSHYADAHRGFCVEFDATIFPLNLSLKVKYSNEYPEFTLRLIKDLTTFIPALMKSVEWDYEKEFRSIFYPTPNYKMPNDGESLILDSDVIKNVYLGSQINDNNKNLIIDLIKQGPFYPDIWITSLHKSKFKLEFALL